MDDFDSIGIVITPENTTNLGEDLNEPDFDWEAEILRGR